MSNETNRPRISETLRYAIFGAVFGFTFPIVGTILEIMFSGKPVNFATMIEMQITNPLLWVVDTSPIVIGLLAGYAGIKQDMLSKTNEQLRARESELNDNQATLEQHAKERTAELAIANQKIERRSAQFEAIARIARTINSVQILDELLPQITQTISKHFSFYHVGIFLLDTNKEYAILAAANSEGGRKMLERNHRLVVGGTGIVGYVTKSGQPRIALDVDQDATYFDNPDLPDTHSEIALPLRLGSEIFGALDVQSTESNAFTEDDISILSILGDQVSVAIQNARSYQQTQEALAQAEVASITMSSQQWKKFLADEPIEGFCFDGVETKKISLSEKEQAKTFAAPLMLRGIRIGTLKLSTTDPSRVWTDDEKDMARATAERTSIAVENARLLLESQKKVAKEQTIGQISSKISSLNDLESLLKTAIKELGATLPNTDIAIQISTDKPGRS